MSKVLVIYDSYFGFTEKMAEAVVEGARNENLEIELLKIGNPFSISKIETTDAIILGSPVIYGRLSPGMASFLKSVKEHKTSDKIDLSGKIGGAFGSYTFSGSWVIRELSSDMDAIGIRIVVPPVSAVDGVGRRLPISLDKKTHQRCHDLGRTIAEELA